MNWWKRLPPAHRDDARAWLTYPGSLTRRVVDRFGAIRVELVQQRLRAPNEDEYRALGRPARKRALVREVLLHAQGEPLVMAHSTTSLAGLYGAWRSLRGLGTRPLAVALFADPLVRRLGFEYARLDRRHPLHARARRLLGRELPAMWARRSTFVRRGRLLMVTEVFLPALLAGSDSR